MNKNICNKVTSCDGVAPGSEGFPRCLECEKLFKGVLDKYFNEDVQIYLDIPEYWGDGDFIRTGLPEELR
jgi:hypothetical protein